MRIVPAASVSPAAWDAYVERHASGWLWHTRGWLGYQAAYYRARGEDLSFAVLDDDGRIAGVAPMFLSGDSFVYGVRPVPAALVRDGLAVGVVVEHVSKVGTEQRATRMLVEYRGDGFQAGRMPRALDWPNAVRRDVRLRVVDLEKQEAPEWSGVRSSYRSLIHVAERVYRITSYSGESEDVDMAFSRYQALHRQEYSSPRPDETYCLQGQWLRQGHAAVTLAENALGTWGAAYWYIWKGEAYYGSGVYRARNVSHAVIWRSLLALKARGVKRAALGYMGEATTDKERQIEFLKAGFGGADEPVERDEVVFSHVPGHSTVEERTMLVTDASA